MCLFLISPVWCISSKHCQAFKYSLILIKLINLTDNHSHYYILFIFNHDVNSLTQSCEILFNILQVYIHKVCWDLKRTRTCNDLLLSLIAIKVNGVQNSIGPQWLSLYRQILPLSDRYVWPIISIIHFVLPVSPQIYVSRVMVCWIAPKWRRM